MQLLFAFLLVDFSEEVLWLPLQWHLMCVRLHSHSPAAGVWKLQWGSAQCLHTPLPHIL